MKNKTEGRNIKGIEMNNKGPIKVLVSHQKAVRAIAYSERNKLLVSCGFDFEVFVWNPYCERYIIKLDGHESPLIGVSCPANIPQFVTCDTKGMVKVWNINDLSEVQTFYVLNVNQVTCISTMSKHRRLVCGSRVFKVFEYPKPFTPELSDDNPIITANYSPIRMEFYIAGERNIKIWNARLGKPVREMKNIMESDITSIEFDNDHRKLVVGDHYGNIKVFDIVSGIEIYQLHAHDSEISFLGYGGKDNTIVTMSWDKRILIHRDEKPIIGEAFDESDTLGNKKKSRGNTMRGKADAHAGDIICGDYSHNLGLIVTGGRDEKVKIWDYERVKLESEFGGHQETLVLAKFIEPFEILLTADQSGIMYLWSIAELTHNKPKCLVEWRNMFTLQ